MKKIAYIISLAILTLLPATRAFAEGGIFTNGGGTKTAGQTFTVSVVANGATFDSLQGTISISGPVDVVSFSAGGATWLPGKTPSNGGQFVGITSETSSLTVATIKLRGKSAGSGSVSVSGARLASKGSVVGTGSNSADFTIERALSLPGKVNVTSNTHPDQNTAYEATTATLSWDKASGVTGFSYLLDQTADTTPAQKVTSADTTASYTNQAVGVYYFHIRAQNGDGWGQTTHFKISIKEPDAKVDETLPKPSNIQVTKASQFVNDVKAGTLSGIVISGITQPSFSANITLDPVITVPEGKTLTAVADESGKFELLLDYPIRSGFYKLTIQGQKDKVLTPVSDPVTFEISQKNGGTVSLLTDSDANEPAPPPPPAPKKWYETLNYQKVSIASTSLLLIAMIAIIILVLKRKRR